MNAYKQTLYVVWGNQLLFLLSLLLNPQWSLLLIAIIGLYAFGCFSETSVHRYYTHKSYETTRRKEYLLRLFSFLAGQGATISWVTVHRTHHAFEDTPKDPHTPLHHPWWRILTGLFPNEYKKNLVIDLMKTKSWNWFVFENKYYWLLWTALWVVSYAINFYFFFFIVSGAAMWYLATSAVNILNHGGVIGKKKWPESVAFNSRIMNVFTAIGYHNNHHKYPASYTYSTAKNEFDFIGFVIKNFLAK